MLVNGEASFVGFATFNDVFISGGTTALGQYHLENLFWCCPRIPIGIGSTFVLQSFQVGSSNTLGISEDKQIFTVSGIGSVGVGTTSARSNLDVIGHTRLETVSRNVDYVEPSSNVVTVDLSSAQNFICTASADINHFVLNNAPPGSSEFTLKIDQDSDGNHYAMLITSRQVQELQFQFIGQVVEFCLVSQPRQAGLTSLHTEHLMVKILQLLVYMQSWSVKTSQTEVE